MWSAPTDTGGGDTLYPLLGYEVTRAAGNDASFATLQVAVNISSSTLSSNTSSGLTKGVAYLFRVRALNRAGFSPYTSTLNITAATAPSAPQAFSALATTALAISISWSVPADTGTGDTSFPLSQYELQYANDILFTSNVSSAVFVASSVSAHTFTNLYKGLTFYFRVRAVSAAGFGTYANPVFALSQGFLPKFGF
jgi:predicted phage tail protein